MEFKNLIKVHNPRKDFLQISDSVELKRDIKFGRMIIAKDNLSAGDIIAIEEPFFLSMDKNKEQNRCALCLKKFETFLACPTCGFIKYCSKKCMDDFWNFYHKYECENFNEIDSEDNFLLLMNRMLFKSVTICGNIENLNKLIDSLDESVTIFDVNNELACCYNLECGNVNDDFLFIDSCVTSPFLKQFFSTKEEEDILKKIILRILGILNRNSFTINYKTDRAGAIYSFGSLINHSCSSNLEKINMGSKAVFICNRPIKKCEQLFLSYRRPFYYDYVEKRQKYLYRQFNFLCECEACVDEKFLQFITLPDFLKHVSKIETFEQYVKNCKYINENIQNYPCYDIIKAVYKNKKFLQTVLDEY